MSWKPVSLSVAHTLLQSRPALRVKFETFIGEKRSQVTYIRHTVEGAVLIHSIESGKTGWVDYRKLEYLA